VFYVAVEGEVTERDYLTYLSHEFGDALGFLIHPLYQRNGLKPREVVAKALEYRDELRAAAADEDPERVELWAVFDCDQHSDIPAAMAEAAAGGVRVAFSHPSFDLWLLLHFSGVPDRHGGSDHERLRRHQGFADFNRHHDKSVTGRRLDALRERHDTAAGHARRLVDECPTGSCTAARGHAAHCDPRKRDPSTDVWRLLAALGVVPP
jgi:hypothetical protein